MNHGRYTTRIALGLVPEGAKKLKNMWWTPNFEQDDPEMNSELYGSDITFVAPERLLKLESSIFSDIWSIGLIVLELITGSHVLKDFQMNRKVLQTLCQCALAHQT